MHGLLAYIYAVLSSHVRELPQCAQDSSQSFWSSLTTLFPSHSLFMRS